MNDDEDVKGKRKRKEDERQVRDTGNEAMT